MFQKILQWIKEVLKRMIGQNTVKETLGVDVAVSTEMSSALQKWSLMYENKADWITADTKSLNLPAAIASEIARAVTIEMQVEVSGSARADFLAGEIAPVLSRLREKIEQGVAKGGMVIKPYVSGKRIAVDFVQADQFYPVSFDSTGNLVACVFADQRTVGDKFYTRLEMHQMVQGGCRVTNRAYRSSSRDTLGQEVALASIEQWATLQPEATIRNVDRPLFAYFRNPGANNVDTNSPLGVSCFSRAVDLIEQADRLWSNLVWEFESGKRALYVDEVAFARDKEGKPIVPDKRLYRTLNGMGPEQIGDDHFFEAWSPEFREASIQSGLNTILQRIEFNCGLAYGTLSDPQSVDKTATEIKTSKQRSYATVADTQKALKNTLEQLLYAMDVWATLGGLAPAGAYATAYQFDDSIMVDTDVQFQQDMRLVSSRLMGRVEFRMRNLGEDEATAKARIAEIDAENAAAADLFAAGA